MELHSSSGSHPVIVVDVIEVAHKRANEVTIREISGNGFLDLDDMLAGMKRFYPDFGPQSEVNHLALERRLLLRFTLIRQPGARHIDGSLRHVFGLEVRVNGGKPVCEGL